MLRQILFTPRRKDPSLVYRNKAIKTNFMSQVKNIKVYNFFYDNSSADRYISFVVL